MTPLDDRTLALIVGLVVLGICIAKLTLSELYRK